MLHLYALDIIFSPVCDIYKRARALALRMLSYYTFDLQWRYAWSEGSKSSWFMAYYLADIRNKIYM